MQMWGASHHSGMAAWTGLGFAALTGRLKPAHTGRDLVHGASVFPIRAQPSFLWPWWEYMQHRHGPASTPPPVDPRSGWDMAVG